MKLHLAGAAWSVGAAAVWVVLGLRSPDLTYHFAPMIAAGAWPVVSRRPMAAVGSGAVALVATLVLWVTDSLRGPDLVSGDASLGEALLFVVVGAAAGGLWAWLRPGATHDAAQSH